jgi:hypothetical protein
VTCPTDSNGESPLPASQRGAPTGISCQFVIMLPAGTAPEATGVLLAEVVAAPGITGTKEEDGTISKQQNFTLANRWVAFSILAVSQCCGSIHALCCQSARARISCCLPVDTVLLLFCHPYRTSEEVGTCARVTAEPGPASLAAATVTTSSPKR